MQIYENILTQPVKSYQDKSFTNSNNYLWVKSQVHYMKHIHCGGLPILKDRLCSGWQYLPQFALYNHVHKAKAEDGKAINIIDVIKIMQSEELRMKGEQIKEAQRIGDMALKAKLKENLPYITHSGIFIPRRNDGLLLPGFTYQLDIDKITNADEILAQLIKDRNLDILFASKSVSGKGVKAMLFLKELLFLRDEWTHEQYRSTYHKTTDILAEYFQLKYNTKIDTQMKSISQPFYLFYAPDLFINKNLAKWI